jgi:hypothetical protein
VPQKGERGDGGIFIDTVVSPFKFFSADASYAHDVAYQKSDTGRGVVLRCYLRMLHPIDLGTPAGRIAFNKIFGTFQRHSKVLAVKKKIADLQDELESEKTYQPAANTYFNMYQNGKLIGSSTRERSDTPYTYKRVDVSLEQAIKRHAAICLAIHQKIAKLEAGIDAVVGKLKQPNSVWDVLDEPDAADKVKVAGFDGIIFLENSGEKSFAVIDANQIKSVKNRGEYSDESPNIHENVQILDEYRNGDKMLAMRQAMENRGMTYVGYGSNALVMRDRAGGIVKIFEPDVGYKAFLTIVQKHQANPHFPKIRKLARFPKGAFSGNYLLKMEPLTPISREECESAEGFHCFLAQTLIRSPYSLNLSFTIRHELRTAGKDVDQLAKAWAEENPDFANALKLISKPPKGCRDDLHRENIMKRSDGTWVIIDPFVRES